MRSAAEIRAAEAKAAFLASETTRRLDEAKAHLEAGDRLAIFHAMKICAQQGVVMPPWLATALIERVNIVLEKHSPSWDDAFGKPWKGVARRNLDTWQRDRIAVGLARLRHENTPAARRPPIDDNLFAEVGQGLKRVLTGAVVKRHWYDCDDAFRPGKSSGPKHSPFAKAAKVRHNAPTSTRTQKD